MAFLRSLSAFLTFLVLQCVAARSLLGFSRQDLIDTLKLTPDDIAEMAGAHGSTADFVRPKTPETIKNSINVYDALHADPKPDIEAMVAKELAKEMPKIKDTCKKCITAAAVPAAKQAWARAMNYCDYAAFDKKSKSACADWKKYPEHFIVNNVLKTSLKPMKAWCQWWKKQC